MVAPHNLNDYYESVLQQITHFLIEKYGAQEIAPPSTINRQKYPNTFFIQIDCNKKIIDLNVHIPFNFPDDFPEIRISGSSLKELYPIPHLSKRGILCTFDSNECLPNVRNPIGVIEAVIERAKSLLIQGINKENQQDYFEEYATYWEQEITEEHLSLISLTNEPKEVYSFTFQAPQLKRWNVLYADTELEGVTWIQNIKAKIIKQQKALYLPLKTFCLPPFPETNRQLIQKLMGSDTCAATELFNYLDNSDRPSSIIFSLMLEDGPMLGGWRHLPNRREDTLQYKGRKKVKRHLKGFRSDVKNARVELYKDFGNQEIKRFSIQRVDNKRLFERGGSGEIEFCNKNIAFIGCGSIGSHMVQAFTDIGLQKMLLVDNDIITFENIARHLCGASDVGKKKVEAIRQKLVAHYPNIDCHTCNLDILNLLCLYENLLNNYDFTVVATGHLPTDLRLNQLLLAKKIRKPILYIWVEPFMAAGHAVWIHPEGTGCLECLFNEQGEYRFQVLQNAGQYVKRESGCQTTYTPYGVMDVKRFINEVVLALQKSNRKHEKQNLVFTWIGDIQEQRRFGRKINVKWAGASSNKLYQQSNLKVSEDCGVC
ncbi:ThiF family adenylyltransferase [Bacillus cereus]|uniref:ThiF family adenylyltransferase n=1 Tax=Bacillus cereus TaxID=1396 RepID=UPI001D0E87CE|nr:ThiF family adenylyltransferase [Bacillus cereus]MCC2382017.1 ThiF family adenylyltransferase [Bacillus cereus]